MAYFNGDYQTDLDDYEDSFLSSLTAQDREGLSGTKGSYGLTMPVDRNRRAIRQTSMTTNPSGKTGEQNHARSI